MINYKVQAAHLNNKLYVGDLPINLDKREFLNLIKTFFPNSVATFKKGRKSYSAIIQLHSVSEVFDFLNQFNFSMIQGKEIRVTTFNPNAIIAPGRNIFIKNLPKTFNSKDLYNIFIRYGEIFSCKVSYDEENKSQGFGFICFLNEESANNAIQSTHLKEIDGKKIYVCLHQKKRPRLPVPKVNLYVKNIPNRYGDIDSFNTLFSPFGNIKSSVIKENVLKEKNKESRIGYFGFVCYERPEDATLAQKTLNGTIIDNSTLFVQFLKMKSERKTEKDLKSRESKREAFSRTLFAKSNNGPITLCKEKIEESFNQFGEVKNITIRTYSTDENGIKIEKNSSIMFIEYKEQSSALRALKEYAGEFQLNILHPKEERISKARNMKRNYNSPGRIPHRSKRSRMRKTIVNPGIMIPLPPYNPIDGIAHVPEPSMLPNVFPCSIYNSNTQQIYTEPLTNAEKEAF